MRRPVLAASLALIGAVHAAPPCPLQPWMDWQDRPLLRDPASGAYLFTTDAVKVDADGAPNAYHPDDVGLNCVKGKNFKGLDCPANGGYPKESWWRSAIVPDPKDPSRAYVQTDGPFKGYLVARTSLQDRSKADTDPAKYVDSTRVPYLVFPGRFKSIKGSGSMGDLGYAINLDNGQTSAFIVAEVGPPDAGLGEMSIALASALGGQDPNPRTGAGSPKGRIAILVFPRSRNTPAWPLGAAEIDSRTEALLGPLGGVDLLKSCAAPP